MRPTTRSKKVVNSRGIGHGRGFFWTGRDVYHVEHARRQRVICVLVPVEMDSTTVLYVSPSNAHSNWEKLYCQTISSAKLTSKAARNCLK